ncbi:MAG TPA: FGGY family carbohydrate kinase [Actinomycetes bacterium]
MSLVGIDIGSTAVKAVAYRESGTVLARAAEAAPSLHPAPGLSESDGDEVWRATVRAVRRLTASPRLRRDPPAALAVSASGREGFPARRDGSALGPCLRTADARRPGSEAVAVLPRSREQWIRACGHVPDHMDPTNRLLWWRERAPRTLQRARWFLGWHELASLRLVGRPVVDPALASGFLLFDLAGGGWSGERLDALGLDGRLLPEIVPWATPLGRIRPRAAEELGLPSRCTFVVGSWDGSCAAVGSAVVEEGDALVAVGTWESVVAPVARPDLRRATGSRLALTPQPSTPGKGLWARSPNGTSVVDWARGVTGTGLRGLEARLRDAGTEPSPVLVVPHLSGAGAPWPEAGHAAGAISGLTLATSPLELVKATMEGIACDLSFAIAALRGAGSPVRRCRVAGGGARSGWWMQLKADLLGVPVEVPDQDEPGSFGAALLAGVGVGAYASLAEATERVGIGRRFDPDPHRAAAFRSKLERHRAAADGTAPR